MTDEPNELHAAAAPERNRGYCYNRVARNPREAAFADTWEKENSKTLHCNFCCGILQDLFVDQKSSRIVHLVTDSERYVAATVVQWLGSNCGYSFLEKALSKCGYRIVEKERL